MKELQEVRNEVLHLKNMGVINKQEETKLLHKLNALEEAISVTRCCTELKDGHPQTFEEWYTSEGYENKWTGFWKEGKSVTYWTVKNRYNTYRNNL
mgnify:CR=1 FL=1